MSKLREIVKKVIKEEKNLLTFKQQTEDMFNEFQNTIDKIKEIKNKK